MLASQITSLAVVYSIVYSGVNQRKHQSSASLAFVREIHRGPVNFPHKWPVTRKMFPFDDVIIPGRDLPQRTLICHNQSMQSCPLLGFIAHWIRVNINGDVSMRNIERQYKTALHCHVDNYFVLQNRRVGDHIESQ